MNVQTLRKALASVSALTIMLGTFIVPGMGVNVARAANAVWAQAAADALVDTGGFTGAEVANGNDPMPRIKFVKALGMINGALDGSETDKEVETWAVDNGILKGDNNDVTKVNPTRPINRAEAVVIAGRKIMAVRGSALDFQAAGSMAGIEAGAWYETSALEAVAAAIIVGLSGSFAPGVTLTWDQGMVLAFQVNRAEMVQDEADAQGADVNDLEASFIAAIDAVGLYNGEVDAEDALVALFTGGGTTPPPTGGSGGVTFTAANPALSISAGTVGSFPLTVSTGDLTVSEIYLSSTGTNTAIDLGTATYIFPDGAGRGNSQSFSNNGTVTLAGMRIKGTVAGIVKVAYRIGATANTIGYFTVTGYKTTDGNVVKLDAPLPLGTSTVNGFIPPNITITPGTPPQTLYIGGENANIMNFNLRNVPALGGSSAPIEVTSLTFRAPTSTDFIGAMKMTEQSTGKVVGCSQNGVVGTYFTITLGKDCAGKTIANSTQVASTSVNSLAAVGPRGGLMLETGTSKTYQIFSNVSLDANIALLSAITVDTAALDIVGFAGDVQVTVTVGAGAFNYTIAAGNLSFNTANSFGPAGFTNDGTNVATVRIKSILQIFLIENFTGAGVQWNGNTTTAAFAASPGGVPFATAAAACAAFVANSTNFAFDVINNSGQVIDSIFSTLGPQVCTGAGTINLVQAGTKDIPTGVTAFVFRADLMAGAAGAVFTVTLGTSAGGLSSEFRTSANRVFAPGTLQANITGVTKTIAATALLITVSQPFNGVNKAPGDQGEAAWIFTNPADSSNTVSAFAFTLVGFGAAENNFTILYRKVGDATFKVASTPVTASGLAVNVNTLLENIKTGTKAGDSVEVKLRWNILSSALAGLRTVTLTGITLSDVDGNVIAGFAVPVGLVSNTTVNVAGVLTSTAGGTEQADFVGTGGTKTALRFNLVSTGINTILKTLLVVFASGNGPSANVVLTVVPTAGQTVILTSGATVVTITFVAAAANTVTLITPTSFSIGITGATLPGLANTIAGVAGTNMTFGLAPNAVVGGFSVVAPVPAVVAPIALTGTAAATITAEAAAVLAATINGSTQYSAVVLKITKGGQSTNFTFNTLTAAGGTVQGLTQINDQNSTSYEVLVTQNLFTTGLALNGAQVRTSLPVDSFTTAVPGLGTGLVQAPNGTPVIPPLFPAVGSVPAITGNLLISSQCSLSVKNPGQGSVSTSASQGQPYVALKLKVEKAGEGVCTLSRLVIAIGVSDLATNIGSIVLEDTLGRQISNGTIVNDPVALTPVSVPIGAGGAFAVFTTFTTTIQETGDYQIRLTPANLALSQSITLTFRAALVGQNLGVSTFTLFGVVNGILKESIFSASSTRFT